MSKKTLNELTLKDNFMFGAVMTNEENCRKARKTSRMIL